MGDQAILKAKAARIASLDALRILFAFVVVCNHEAPGAIWLPEFLSRLAVPFFMVLSFALVGVGGLKSPNERQRVARRLFRIGLPFIAWGAAAWVVRSALTGEWCWSDLAWQCIYGHMANPPIYFLFCMVVCVAVLALMGSVARPLRFVLVSCVALLCFWLQANRANFEVCSLLAYPMRFSVGRVAELLPSACAGSILSAVVLQSERGGATGLRRGGV